MFSKQISTNIFKSIINLFIFYCNMGKLYIFITAVLLGSSSFIFSQEQLLYGVEHENKNYVYGDIGFGIVNLAGSLRLNYERQIFKKKSIILTGRVGIGYWMDWTSFGVETPLSIQAIFFKSASHLELGIGARWYSDLAEKESGTNALFNFGYRYQKPGKKLLFRINAEYFGSYLIPLISLGASF
ncbi:MAG: hypothetical protein DRJ07_05320 [Bacteroidetes bacterium]|nr:MAG: hypothetical protein DRJ07_05320 [Bacteroidota bacterium]